jgi:hypothetical protein
MRGTIGIALAAGALYLVSSSGWHDASAARASKPREIVVVGSKVKEVIREAGFTTSEEVVRALNQRVIQLVVGAARRAEANGRTLLQFHDLDCWADPSSLERIVDPGAIVRLLGRVGFEADDPMIDAISDKTRAILGDAMTRAASNGRSTVRPYDL